jgi:hypothetical protein
VTKDDALSIMHPMFLLQPLGGDRWIAYRVHAEAPVIGTYDEVIANLRARRGPTLTAEEAAALEFPELDGAPDAGEGEDEGEEGL